MARSLLPKYIRDIIDQRANAYHDSLMEAMRQHDAKMDLAESSKKAPKGAKKKPAKKIGKRKPGPLSSKS